MRVSRWVISYYQCDLCLPTKSEAYNYLPRYLPGTVPGWQSRRGSFIVTWVAAVDE